MLNKCHFIRELENWRGKLCRFWFHVCNFVWCLLEETFLFAHGWSWRAGVRGKCGPQLTASPNFHLCWFASCLLFLSTRWHCLLIFATPFSLSTNFNFKSCMFWLGVAWGSRVCTGKESTSISELPLTNLWGTIRGQLSLTVMWLYRLFSNCF